MAWTTPRTYVVGETVTAAMLNTHLRDNLSAIGDWASFSPTWDGTGGSTDPTIGDGTLEGRYIQAGSLVIFRIKLEWGSTTTAGDRTLYQWTLPSALNAVGDPVNIIADINCAGSQYHGLGFANATTTLTLRTAHDNAAIDYNSPGTWTNGDYVRIAGVCGTSW